jgi:hypothetical protein
LPFIKLYPTAVSHEYPQAKVEYERLLDLGKVVLWVEVGWVGDNPPAATLTVDVVKVVGAVEDPTWTNFLD